MMAKVCMIYGSGFGVRGSGLNGKRNSQNEGGEGGRKAAPIRNRGENSGDGRQGQRFAWFTVRG